MFETSIQKLCDFFSCSGIEWNGTLEQKICGQKIPPKLFHVCSKKSVDRKSPQNLPCVQIKASTYSNPTTTPWKQSFPCADQTIQQKASVSKVNRKILYSSTKQFMVMSSCCNLIQWPHRKFPVVRIENIFEKKKTNTLWCIQRSTQVVKSFECCNFLMLYIFWFTAWQKVSGPWTSRLFLGLSGYIRLW